MDFKFYNTHDRAILRGEDPDKEPDWSAYKKVPRKIPKPKKVLDEEGFYMPVPDSFKHTETGLCCDMFGATPENILTDTLALLGEVAKEIYEIEMRHLTWHIRYDEVRRIKNFAQFDMAINRYNASDDVKSGRKKPAETICKRNRRKILRSVTWKYDWIQLYKKDCYLFADYVIKWLKDLNNPERVVVGTSEGEREALRVAFEKKETAKLDGRLRSLAEAYMACEEQKVKEEAFCEKFMAWANNLPEMNRSLVDFMYETAWNTIMAYVYEEMDDTPAPFYSVLYSNQLEGYEYSLSEEFDEIDSGGGDSDGNSDGDDFADADFDDGLWDDEEMDELDEEFLCGSSDGDKEKEGDQS